MQQSNIDFPSVNVTSPTVEEQTVAESIDVFRANGGLTLKWERTATSLEDASKQLQQINDILNRFPLSEANDVDILVVEFKIVGLSNIKLQFSSDDKPVADGIEVDSVNSTVSPRYEIRGTFWGTEDALNFFAPNATLAVALPVPSNLTAKQLDERREIVRELNARNERLGIPYLGTLPSPTAPQKTPRRRKGARLQAKPDSALKAPMAETAKNAYVLFQSGGQWKQTESGEGIYAQLGETQLVMDCDLALGFGPEIAIQQTMRYGSAVAQTFLALAGFWISQKGAEPRDSYLEADVTDLLRYMGRKEKPKGGYGNDDIMAQGRNIYLLGRIRVPRATRNVYSSGKFKTVEEITIGNLFIVDEQAIQRALDFDGNEMQSVITFRYHMGSVMYDWLCGDTPQYALISSKLLQYHPIREKYPILLGFCLAYYDRVNMRKRTKRVISLTSLLRLANQEIPERNIDRYLISIEMALNQLSNDNVIPGVELKLPEGRSHFSARQIIELATIEFPAISRGIESSPNLQQVSD